MNRKDYFADYQAMPMHVMKLFGHEKYLDEVIFRDCLVVLTPSIAGVKFRSKSGYFSQKHEIFFFLL